MIRCIAVDDEAYAANIIADYISKIPFLELVGKTTSPIEAINWVQDGKVDLVFLDIQMPELTGIQFLKICGSKCKVILTTAYPEYALEGYEHDVIDYLLKPIPFDRFYRAVTKAQSILKAPKQPEQPAFPPQENTPSATAPTPDYMFVKGESKNKFLKVAYSDILYVEGLKNYVSLYLPGQRLVTYQSLTDLTEQLPQPPFYRVHRSYIISIDKVSMVDGNIVYIADKEIPVGETYRDGFFSMIREKSRL
ncbi:LytR/AlgR family response regulator transcription factor [Pontibacter chinhatensis]|uniref:Two component transcriptional regulator, LytTR family n=1 Tax=Pontibacter chinhatensis TaxID=1436961 RepID=A0A1I2MGK9_9BACT|nr:LytTR family DNA-binding domain-containing protein [Pontibacter chinhatensis]SFF88281.1 two component transcriptional regulator, LytTR family [Pontibacter chinhatensis]